MAQVKETQPMSLLLPDWFTQLPESSHSRLFIETKWEETAMGSLKTWSPELRLHIIQAFMDKRPVCIFWYASCSYSPSWNFTNQKLGGRLGLQSTTKPML